MKTFFKSMFLLMVAGLYTATSWAVTLINPIPTASFTDFSSIPTGTTTEAKTIPVNGVTLTLPVGVTKNDDGSIYLNNKTGAKVTLSRETQTIAVVLDLAAAPVAPENPGNTSYTLLVNFDSGTDIAAAYTGTGIQGAWGGSLSGRGAVKAWTPEATKVLAATSSTGGTTIRVKDNTDANKWNEGGLKASGNRYQTIELGPTLTLKGIYVYDTYVENMPTFTEVSAYERTIEGTANWAATDAWATGVANPEAGTSATLNVTGDVELTMNDASNALNYLEINGSGSLTITGSNPLTAASTIVKANTIVETSASLGAVTLENDATLTVKSLSAFTSIAGEGTLALDLGDEADVEYTGNFPTTVKLSLLSGTLTYKHDGADRAIKALNIAERATFADVANYKHHLTINDKFSGAGTYLVKVPTESSQTDGWRYLFVNGDAAEFTGNVKLQIKHNANQNGGAPYRTGMRLTGTSFGGTVTAEATGEGVTDADLAYAHLDIDESLTMTKAQSFAGKIDIASGKTLTASNGITLTNAGKLEGTGTIAAPFTYSSSAETSFSGIFSGDLTVSAGVLEIATKQNSVAHTVGVTVDGGVLRLDVDHNGISDNNVVFAEGRTITVNAGGVLELERGYGYFKIAGNGLTKVVDSNFYFGVSGGGTNNITTALEVDTDKTFWIRNWGGTNYKLTPASLTLNGNLKRNTAAGNGAFTVETSSLKGSGTVDGMTLALAENATIDVTSGAVNATTTATLPSAFMVKISADQDATGVVIVMTSPNVVITDKTATVWVGEEAEYTLHADAATVWVEKAGVELLETVEVTFTEGGTLVLSDALDGKALAPSATLEINFGDKGENEPNPGIFEFDCDAAFAQITITGTNGGTITKTGTVTVTASSTTIDADTTVNAGAANLGTVTINAEKTLTVKENWANVATNVPTTATNLGKIRFEGGSAETPIVFSMGSAANGNPGALVMAPGAYVKLMSYHNGSETGNKVYNITGETDGEKPNVYLYASKGWGMSDGSVVRNVKLIVPSADNNDFWLRPGVTDATVDLELQGRKLTGDSGNGAIVLGDFVTNAEVVANGKSLSVQTGHISGTAGFDSAIAVDNSGEGTFTVARTYGAALTINGNGSVTVAEGGSLTGSVTVTGKLTYAADATPTNTITNNGTITVDTATVDLTGATISGTGTYAVTNGGTLILKAGTENGASVTSGTLKLLLSEENIVKGYTANVAAGTTVTFVVAGDVDGDGDGYDTVTEGVDGNEYAAPMNVWTPSEDATWANTANWSNDALPSETDNVEIQITEDTELELSSDVTVAALRVVGSGTLTIRGGKLTASFIDAETAISASDETLALVPMTIAENAAVTYGTTVDAAMPAVTGLGDFVKTGAAKLTLDNATACEATIDVTDGTLELSGNPGSAWTYAYSGVYRFIAREGATIDIANAFIEMPSTESEITLKGGALLNIKNGNTWENRRSIGAKILIEESSAEKPAIIKGSTNGDYSKLTGGITGSGVLEIQGNGNTFAITGAIKDQENAQLAVKINTANGVTFSGANTYTGGTEVAANALLMVNNFGNLGNLGMINVQGKLQFSNSSNSGTNNQDVNAWARLQGSGTIQFENASGNNWYAIRSIATTLDVVNNNRDPNTQDTDDHGGLVVTHDATIGTLSGEGWFRSDLNNSNRTLTIVQSKASEFSGYFKSYANSGGRKLNVLVQSNDATPKTLTLSGNSIHTADAADVNTLTIDTTGSVCLTGSWQGNLTNNGILSGRGTITGTLTFGNAAMLDVSAGEILTANTLADLPAALTVKVANALEVGGALDIMTTTATPNTASMTVTVKVGEEAVKGIYSLVATGTTLQLVRGEDSLMGSVYLADSNAALTEKIDSGKMGDGDQWGVQIDMDAAKPYGPGWQATQALKTFSVVRAKNDVSQSWENMTVSIVDIEDTTTVLATSEVGVEETDYILTYSGGGTEGRKLLTFTFATAVNLDASKTYQFRFNEARKIRMIHIQSISDDAKNTNAINVLNSNFVVEKATEYTPIVELGVEIPALVINASAVPVDVAEVPTALALDTASFMGGYGTTYTVLNYTGEGAANWQGMTCYGLPEGAEVFTTDKTWGFTMKMIRVLPIGDSITAGLVTYHNSSANWHVAGGYRLPLYQYMTQAYGEGKVKYLGTSTYPTSVTGDSSQNSYEDRDIDSVTLTEAGQLNHEGHSGASLDGGNKCQIYDRFKNQNVLDIIAEQGAPDVITLHLGTNDFGMSGDTVETAMEDMKKLLFLLNGSGTDEAATGDTPLYPNAIILVAKIIPRASDDLMTNKIGPFNTKLEEYVTGLNSDKLVLVDLNMACNYGLLRHDGLHPSTEGYSRMAQNWFVNIEAALPPMGAEASIAVVDARVTNTLKVTTNKAIDTSLTQTWSLDKDATVSAATITDDKRTVILTVEGVVANTEYTLTVTNLFAADDSVTKSFTTTADIHTPTVDVVESDRTGAVNTVGVLKAAEWTTFAGFATGYTSPIGYMPESGRPWQLDVRGTNVPTVTDGVLSLNGAPLTVNFKDGHIGTTKSVRTTVMEVSNLSAGDVLFTETGNGNELNKITVVDADTLTWNSGSVETIELASYGINLMDDIPEVITETFAAIGGGYNCKLTVNGIEVATSNWTSSGEWVNGNWTIGANSTANAGSTTMKLYRLSFYEGAATVTVPDFVVINVGEGDGQYTTWSAAQTALGFEDQMTAVTINFTAEDQTFTFNNTDAVAIDAVTVIGSNGGTIATAGSATVTATALAINTLVTMNDDAMALTGDVAIAADCVLTYNVGDGMTVNATHSGAGSIAVTSGGVYGSKGLTVTKTCGVNVSVGDYAVYVADVEPGDTNSESMTKAFANNTTVTVAEQGALSLKQGISFNTINSAGTVEVDGTYTLGFGQGENEGSLTTAHLIVNTNNTLKVKAFRAIDVVATGTICVYGSIVKDTNGSATPNLKVTADSTLSIWGTDGAINLPVIFEDGTSIYKAAIRYAPVDNSITLGAAVTLPAQLAITLPNDGMPTEETPAVLLKTTAFAGNEGVHTATLNVNGRITDEYVLYKTAEAVELRYAPWTTVTEVTAEDDVDSWSKLLADMEAKRLRFDTTADPSLVIDFGDGNEPGTFTFDMGEGDELDGNAVFTFGTVTIRGSAGGTVAKTGSANISANATVVNTNVEIAANAMLLGQTTLAANCTLTVNDGNALGEAANFAADATSTVKLVNVDKNTLNLGKLVPNGSNLILNNVKAYIYDCTIGTLTLEGDFQMNNGTTNKKKTQCVTVNTLAGAGTFIGHQGSEVYVAMNVKSWDSFTGAIDLSSKMSNGMIFFFGEAPQRFIDAALNAYDADDAQEYFANDYGTIYVTEGKTLVTTAGTTWHLRKLVVEDGASFQINGWATIATSCTGAVSVENGGVLDLRALNDLSGINVTVKAGGRLLVNTGATVPNNIVFETGSILGVATKHVEDVGNATLTVNVDGTAATTATIKGYHMDGVTLLDNWAKNNETSSEGEFKFNFDPVFDGELCWWAYEFDNEVNTSPESNLGPISTGRDKGRMNFDGRGDSNRVCQGDEYVDHRDGTKAIRVASSPWRDVSGGYPTAFTAAMYGTLTENRNRIIMGFGSSYNQKYTIALVTGASTDEVRLVLQKGWNENNTDYPEDAVITLATTTVPNAVVENHLFAFSYEQFDSNADETLDSTRIIFYVDGEKYQPFTAKAIIPLGNGFQMGSIHGGWHNSLTRMNGDDVDCTMEYLRIYDQILPESVWTAMSNEYSYMSKNGRATRTIVAGQDTTWNENTEWTQIRAVKDGEDYVLDAEGHVTFDNGTAVEKPEHGENVGTQVVLNVSGENTLYLNEFYSTTTNPETGKTDTTGNSKLYYERLEINPVEGGDEDSLTLWAGRNNPDVAEGNKNSQSAVITVQGYTKINTNVTMAHNVAFLSGPVAVAEGKWLHFDFSGFDVMKVPSMPVTYRLTGFLDEDTRTRVTSTAPADPVNARSIDLGYKTTVNQYTFTVNRYPVTAYFTADDDSMVVAHNNDTTINFNSLYYIWQGNEMGKQMNWEAEAVDPQGNPIVENTLAKFVSLDAETQQEKMVTVTLATNDAEGITLTLNEDALTKETTPAGTDGEGNPTEAVVENMLGGQQLIVGNNVIVNYTGTAATLARTLNEASAETTGVIRTAGFTVDAWRANLSVTGGALAGVGKISGKVTFEVGATLDASAATAEACLSAKDADLTNLKAITVDYESVDAAGTTGLKVLALPEGNTAQTLTGCVVTAVMNDGNSVEWTESGDDPTLVVRRADGIYVVGRPVVKAGETEVTNNDLTLPLARRAAELSATSVSLTGVVNTAGDAMGASVADAAEVFTNVAFDMTKTPDANGAVEAKLKYDFGVTKIGIAEIEGVKNVVLEVTVSNVVPNTRTVNTADFVDGVSLVATVGGKEVDTTAVTDMTGDEEGGTGPVRYVRFAMPTGLGTSEIGIKATNEQPAQEPTPEPTLAQ